MRESQFLIRDEIHRVIRDARRRARTSRQARLNLTIFRLSCCCGLRVSEICGLNCGDLKLQTDRPEIHVRKETAKGKKGRYVKIWWDKGTLDDLRIWLGIRLGQGAKANDPFICGQFGTSGKRLTRDLAAKRWRTAIQVLGPERVKQLHIHCGRHSYISHSLASGRSLPEVQENVGHSSIGSTNAYVHFIESTRNLPDVFG